MSPLKATERLHAAGLTCTVTVGRAFRGRSVVWQAIVEGDVSAIGIAHSRAKAVDAAVEDALVWARRNGVAA